MRCAIAPSAAGAPGLKAAEERGTMKGLLLHPNETRMRAALFLTALLATPAFAAGEGRNPVDIREWPVPFEEGRPRDPDAVARDSVWFVGQVTDYIAEFDPTSGRFDKVDLEPGTGPHNLIVGDDGIVWFAGNKKAYIGRYDPNSGEIEKIAMPDPDARDPHTLIFDADQSHIWFTVQFGNFIGRLSLADRAVDLIAVPTERARPYGIKLTAGGTPWIALFGTHKLASVDPDSLELSEHPLPHEDARPRRIGVSGGALYYTDYARGTLGRFDPATAESREWAMPSGGMSRPYGMAVDGDGRIWAVETGVSPNLFVGFDPRQERFFSVAPIPSDGGVVRHMDYFAPTDTIWFGADTGTIGRAKMP